jgi:hypothetical protein
LEATLIAAGVVFVGAAIVGGGMVAFKVEVPLIDSLPRQVLLAVFGILLLIAGFVTRGIDQGPTQPTSTAAPTTQAVGPAGETLTWIHNPTTDHYYMLTEPGRSWSQLAVLAGQLGGDLVSIGDAREEEWLYSQFGPDPFWIGFTDQAVEGDWVWTTGETVSYVNWCAGEPSDTAGGAGTEDAAHAIPTRSCWNDEPVWVTEFLDAERGVMIPSYPGVIEIDRQPS